MQLYIQDKFKSLQLMIRKDVLNQHMHIQLDYFHSLMDKKLILTSILNYYNHLSNLSLKTVSQSIIK